MSEHGVARWLGAAAALVVVIVAFDVGRRSLRTAAPPAESSEAPVSAPAPAPSPMPPPPLGTPADPLSRGTGSQPGVVRPMDEASPSYMDQVARADARRQIRASVRHTYLNEMVAASPDSILRRWEDRSSPVRVYIPLASRVVNFQPAFIEAIRAALREWESVGLPIRFDARADSGAAEVRIRWRVQFEEERTGQTDLVWDAQGRVQGADVTLATFDPSGRPMNAEAVRIVMLHEVGHVLGLDHSPESTDLMHAVAKVTRLSPRDVATAQLLYRLSPGSLR